MNDAEDDQILICEKCQFETQKVLILNEHMKKKHRTLYWGICKCTSSSDLV